LMALAVEKCAFRPFVFSMMTALGVGATDGHEVAMKFV
jgi:hypothetical protein